MAGGDFEGAAEAVEDGSGPAEVGGDAGGDFVPTGADSLHRGLVSCGP